MEAPPTSGASAPAITTLGDGLRLSSIVTANASRDLARPIDETLFFAGEATDTSGTRAAAQCLRALRPTR